MSLNEIWQDRQDNVHDVTADDINGIAHAVIKCEEDSEAHNSDTVAHITSEERKKWNKAASSGGNSGSLAEDLSPAVLLAMYNEVDVELIDESCFIFDESTCSITGLDASTADKWAKLNSSDTLVFPYSINGVLVQSISNGSVLSSWLSGIRKVRLPNSIKRIGDNAFKNCYGMGSINIPTSCEYIGVSAFEGSSLSEIITPIKPNWELEIGEGAFSGTGFLNNIDTIIDGIKTIPAKAFYGCEGVRTVTIPESVNTVGSEAFGNCENMVIITILNPMATLEDGFCDNSVTLRGYNGANAWQYAQKHGNHFVAIDAENNGSQYIDASEVAM